MTTSYTASRKAVIHHPSIVLTMHIPMTFATENVKFPKPRVVLKNSDDIQIWKGLRRQERLC
jgi:hypothetical protein